MMPLVSSLTDQIRFLLQSVNSANSDSVFHELCEYTAFGVEESILLLRTCLDLLDTNGNEQKSVELQTVLTLIFKHLLNSPNFSTMICNSVANNAINEDRLGTLCDVLHLTASERIGIGLALSDSDNIDIRMCGNNFCMSQITELCSHPMAIDSSEQIQQILLFLNQSEDLSKHTGVDYTRYRERKIHVKGIMESSLDKQLN